MASNIYSNQIQNRNFLSPTGFKFILNRAPKVAFFSNSANIPSLDLGIATQPTYLKDLDIPGDKILFEDFSLRFLVDEDIKNYMEIQNWIRGLGYPESRQEIIDLQTERDKIDTFESGLMDIYSDGTLTVLGSNQRPNFMVKFKDLFPYSLSTLNFDATDTDVEYFTADVSFKYTIYEITDLEGTPL
jgi:hypothetical protein|tara:strand:- start:724 stop:1284 length:561 start_codon:yes stop_codon:yes gene_type:complete